MIKGKIFTAQEVQAILKGNKTMFREVIKPFPVLSDDKSYWEFEGVRWAGEKSSYAKNFGDNVRPEIPDLCPYQVGQKIFVKERFCVPNTLHQVDEEIYGIWKPAQHMKQEQSRLTLLIKEIRVERLADISEKDAVKEGFFTSNYWHRTLESRKARESFIAYWNATHKKPEEKFEANCWCWVVDFEVVK